MHEVAIDERRKQLSASVFGGRSHTKLDRVAVAKDRLENLPLCARSSGYEADGVASASHSRSSVLGILRES